MMEIIMCGVATLGIFAGLFALSFYFLKYGMDKPGEKSMPNNKTGEIIETIQDGKMNRVFSCCGTDFTQLTKWIMPKYCPECGAKILRKREAWRDGER